MTSNKVRSMHRRIVNHLNFSEKKLKINSDQDNVNVDYSQLIEGAGAGGLPSTLV